MSIDVQPIDLGEVEGGLTVSIEEMIRRLNKRLASMVPDPEVYEIDASIKFEEESGIYIATGVARHKTRDVYSSQKAKYLAEGTTLAELEEDAYEKARKFFGTEDVTIKLPSFNGIAGKFSATVTATRK